VRSPAELTRIWGQEALTNRFESPVSETDRLIDRQQLNAYFFGSIAGPIEVRLFGE